MSGYPRAFSPRRLTIRMNLSVNDLKDLQKSVDCILINAGKKITEMLDEKEMEKIADIIFKVIREIEKYKLPAKKEDIRKYLKKFEKEMSNNRELKKIKREVKNLCKKFPIYKNL